MTTKDTSGFKKYPLIFYFILAYAVTWCFQIPLALSARGLIEAHVPMAIHYLGAFGPAGSEPASERKEK